MFGGRKSKTRIFRQISNVKLLFILLVLRAIWNIYTMNGMLKFQSESSSAATDMMTIEVVIAYCSSPLTWVEKDVIQDTLKEFGQASFYFTIMSKCGREEDIPDFSSIDAVKSVEVVPTDNVGGCDYAYAKFLNDNYIQGRQKRGLSVTATESESSVSSNNVVLFIKDTPREPKNFHAMKCISDSFRSIQELIRTPSETKKKFACGTALTPIVSDYHEVKTLHNFRLNGYTRIQDRGKKGRSSGGNQFNPQGYKNLGDFHETALQWTFPRQDYALVCYGGTFSVSQNRLLSLFQDKKFTDVMKIIESAVSQSNMNVVEHYVERTWAGLLSKPLTDEEASSFKANITGIVEFRAGVDGALLVKADYTCNSRYFHFF